MQFDKFPISSEILKNLKEMGFHRTTDIQYKSIPPILNGEDVLAIAQTGTGKTAAFAIPIIHKIHEFKTSKKTYGIKCIVLTPTRELAKQVGQVFARLSRGTKTTTYALYGGVEQDPQKHMIEGGIDILIATPGRMFDLVAQKAIDIRTASTFVIDEADQMLDLGFADDIKSIKKILGNKRHQTLFFSATINPKIKKLAYSQIQSSAMRIQVSPEQIVAKNVSHYITKVPMDEKRHLLTNFIQHSPETKTIVFVRTQVRAERVQKHLAKNGIDALSLHGGMSQEDRMNTIDVFSKMNSGIVIATDLSARGIDFSKITHVLNYDLPDVPENYVHRVGRTGRGMDLGEAISFCSEEELVKLKAIESFLSYPIEEVVAEEYNFSDEGPQGIEAMDISEILAMEEENFSNKKKKTKNKRG
ncbi:MAG: DEAD/DEAH box helicase [Bdellovibrionales bacterium]